MRILIVDDSSTMRTVITRGLQEALGAETVEAENGEEGLRAACAQPQALALILLDWNMPVLDGFQTLTALKADPATASIPVVMVTTQAERANVVEAAQAGAVGYVAKPFQMPVLISKIRKVLSLPEEP